MESLQRNPLDLPIAIKKEAVLRIIRIMGIFGRREIREREGQLLGMGKL